MQAQLDKHAIISTLETWSSVNTGSDNLSGIERFAKILRPYFEELGASIDEVELPHRKIITNEGDLLSKPVGKALVATKRPDVHPRILLVGHLDTVFPEDSPFQTTKLLSENRLNGPGVADMKGGVLILLETLKMWESSPHHAKLGWQVILNPDEEVGSPCSQNLLMDAAREAEIGLIFEPSFPDGTLVSERRGSATFTLIARGVSAHAGRAFHLGKNAVTALSPLIVAIDRLNSPTLTVNVGTMHGGIAPNIVPDLAMSRIGIRAETADELDEVLTTIEALAKEQEITTIRHTVRPPKPFDPHTQKLFELLRQCGETNDQILSWEPTGGVCDGNFLAAAGLPTIDTLGVVGGDIHTYDEYVELDSIPQRINLVFNLLTRIAQDGTPW